MLIEVDVDPLVISLEFAGCNDPCYIKITYYRRIQFTEAILLDTR
jgi:hypothetical protein